MEEQRVSSFFRFEDLRVYHKSLEYYNWLMNQVDTANDFAKRVLLMPMLDSAAKISLNIAEGTSYHKSQFVNYLKFAKTAVRECVVFTTLAEQNGLFTEEQVTTSKTTLIEMTKMLGAMVVSLQKPHNRKNSEDSTEDISTPQTDNSDYGLSDFSSELNY